jgi:hypothetical protein
MSTVENRLREALTERASGELLTARTVPGWPGSGVRLWAAFVPAGLRQAPEYVALGYDAGGHVVWQVTTGESLAG